jgi:hypothetical protein
MRKLTALTIPAALVAAGAALAATPGTVVTQLTPNTPKKNTTLHLTATGPFSGVSGLPSSLVIDVQKGFKSSLKAVKTPCTSQQEGANPTTCPAESQIGQGTASVSVFGATSQLLLTMYLGKPQHNGDIASVELVVQSQALGQSQDATGRILPHAGGVEVRFDQLPTFAGSIPGGVPVTVNSIYLSAGARTQVTNKVHGKKVTTIYPLIQTPPSCPRSGNWTGHLTVQFQTGTFSKALASPCKKK